MKFGLIETKIDKKPLIFTDILKNQRLSSYKKIELSAFIKNLDIFVFGQAKYDEHT